MKNLMIASILTVVLVAGVSLVNAEEGSQCSAMLVDGSKACQATCSSEQAAVCEAGDDAVHCGCESGSSEDSHDGHGDDEGDGDDDGDNGDGGDNGNGGDNGGDRDEG